MGTTKKSPGTTRQNFDKRSIRRMYQPVFESAIQRLDTAGTPLAQTLSYSDSDVHVYARKRPLFEREQSKGEYDVLSVVQTSGSILLHDCKMHSNPALGAVLVSHSFPLPCIGESASNAEVCDQVELAELLQLARAGGHATCCVFGQTGSGKTFTLSGILQATADLLFASEQQAQVACFEVCGKDVFDLLKQGQKLAVREDGTGQVQVSTDTRPVSSSTELLDVLKFAAKQRTTSSTLKNMHSSRSHAFYRITLPRPGEKAQASGSVTFVDLAGSERTWDSMFHDAEQRKQCAEINTSLSALKECVRLRAQQLRTGVSRRVPYRDNRLTMLLRDSFESSAKRQSRLVLIVTVAPGAADTEHSMNTLRNGCLMAGLEANADVVSRTEVPLVDSEVHQSIFRPQVRHPAKWTPAEVHAWVQSAGSGAFTGVAAKLPVNMDGKALVRLPLLRFNLLCGDDLAGVKLYKLLKDEIQKANLAKSKAVAALRHAKATISTG